MPDEFADIVLVPPDIAIREVNNWLTSQLPAPITGKTRLVLFDGRESSDDNVGVSQLLSALNQLLRKRPDVLFCWPTTDLAWHGQIRSTAEQIGGSNLAPKESDIQITGPARGEWPTVLQRLLLQFQRTEIDVGLTGAVIGECCANSATLGDFLADMGMRIADRTTKARKTKSLPTIVFVITSSGDVVGEANRIRRGGMQWLSPEPLLGHSPQSEAGKWWVERNKNRDHHLAYIISLFDARLVTMKASAVVYSCLHNGVPSLAKAATDAGAIADIGNAKRTIEVSEFFRFLAGTAIPEFTSGKKGSTQDSTKAAYAAIQSLSAKQHKSINKALCGLIRANLPTFTFEDNAFEIAHGGDLITDAEVSMNGRSLSIEFHHLSEGQCAASKFASYIMKKLRLYAIHHNIIPR